jgi:hypothetical protein
MIIGQSSIRNDIGCLPNYINALPMHCHEWLYILIRVICAGIMKTGVSVISDTEKQRCYENMGIGYMNTNEPNREFDDWLTLNCWPKNVPRLIYFKPTKNASHAIELLELFLKDKPGWWVDIGYCPQGDFPWHVWIRKDEELYQPLSSGYPLALVICRVIRELVIEEQKND